jgi:hypothetical protein
MRPHQPSTSGQPGPELHRQPRPMSSSAATTDQNVDFGGRPVLAVGTLRTLLRHLWTPLYRRTGQPALRQAGASARGDPIRTAYGTGDRPELAAQGPRAR